MCNVGSGNQGMSNVSEESKLNYFTNSLKRYDVRTVGEVMTALENGLKHVIQAGIDRANQVYQKM